MVFLVPDGPTEYWVDNWVIPTASEHPVAAHKWINYVLEPVVAGREMNYHQYPVPVVGIQGVDPDLANDPVIDIPNDKIEGYESQIETREEPRSSATAPTRSSRRPSDGGGDGHRRRRAGGRAQARPPDGRRWPASLLLALAVGSSSRSATSAWAWRLRSSC